MCTDILVFGYGRMWAGPTLLNIRHSRHFCESAVPPQTARRDRREYYRKYRQQHKEKLKEKDKNYYHLNKDKIKLYHKQHPVAPETKTFYRKSEKKRTRTDYNTQYRMRNISNLKQYQRIYYRQKKEELREYSAQYYEKNKGKFANYNECFIKKKKEELTSLLNQDKSIKV